MRLFGKHKENIIYYMLYLFSDVFSKALPFLLLPFLTRIFSTEQYGELTEFTVVYNICFMLGAFSCQTFFRKLFFENNDMGGRYLSLLISPLIITITTVIVLNAVIYFTTLLSSITFNLTLFVAVSVFSQIIIRVTMTYFNCSLKATNYMALNVFATLVNLIVTYIFLYLIASSFNGRVMAIIISPIIVFPLAIAIYTVKNKTKWIVRKEYIREHFCFAIPLVPHQIMSWFRISFDRIIISSTFGLSTLGEFSVNSQLAMVIFVLFTSINQGLAPRLLKLYKNENSNMFRSTLKYLLIFIVIFVLIFPVIIMIAPYVIGEGFEVDYLVISTLSVAYLFNGFYFIFTHYLIQNGHGFVLSKVTIFTGLIHVLIIYLLIPVYGVNSVLIASIVSYFAAFILTMYITKKLMEN
tara:strand:+ start:7522 stop:8751 length:1230 start_codon:yes stop_codon:yes gene_type:complete